MTDERALYRHDDLDRLVDPAVIAVVGASHTPGSFGQRTLANLGGFSGRVYAVNPKYTEVAGRICVPTLLDLPETPDAVVLCVARPLVEAALRDAITMKAGGAIIYASGFAETAIAERMLDQDRLVTTARAGNLRLAGPNCVGLTNLRSGAATNFMTDCGDMIRGRAGHVAIVSQSGALGYSVLQAAVRGFGISHYLAAGNSADVDVCDFVAYLAEAPDVRAIVLLFEGVRSGKRLVEAARLAEAAGRPLIVCKAGNTDASAKAALSHTGTLVGAAEAYRAAFEATGAIQTDDLEAVLELAGLFCKAGRPKAGRGVGIMATSGGAGVICADKASQKGLPLPDLAPATRTALEAVVPDFGSVANPSDLTAEVLKTSSTFAHCLNAFADDPGFSAVVLPLVFAHPGATGARAPVICEVAGRTDSLIAAVWVSEWLEGPGSALLEADPKVVLFRSGERCFDALRAWFHWHERRARPEQSVPGERRSPPMAAKQARAVIAEAGGGRALGEQDSKRVLAAYGITTPGEAVAATPGEAAAAAARIGYPVVVKIASADIVHKTEIGGIRLDLRSDEAVRDAATAILASARQHKPNARIAGVSVQQMVPPGVELVLGVRNDAQFGPLLAVGSGGVMVELLRDATTSLVPVSADRAREMLGSLRSHALLAGFRGQPPKDTVAAADLICRLSELAADLADVLEELDVNPVIVGTTGAVAADALFVLKAGRDG